MDELDTSFGRLSTHAAEWRPGGVVAQVSTTTSSNTQSDLNASSVKEFVPGKGWTSTSTMTTGSTTGSTLRTLDNQAHSAEEQSTPEQYQESVQPAGPTPPDPPTFQSLHSMGLPDELWRYYRGLSLAASRQMDPSDPRHRAVPLPYCNAYCLDDDHPLQQRRQQKTQNQTQRRSSFFGYPSQTFCVTSRQDGHLYCLRRFDNVRTVSPKIAAAVSDRWTSIAAVQQHPGLVPVYQCFCAQRAVFFVHQYMPASRTLQERLLTATSAGSSGSSSSHGSVVFSEAIIWSCVCQLVSAIRAVHTNQLAVRSLRLQYILSVSQPQKRLRVRINCLGIVDALEFEARKHVSDLQQQDLRDLGYLILSMACGAEVTSADDMANVTRWEGLLAQNYTPELHNLAMTLIRIGDNVRGRPRPPSIMDVSRALALRCMDEQEQAYRSLDRTEQALSSEYESGRILRLLLKLGFINERPEFGPDRRWAQSGDCYVLTLFRDYVFHQADPGGYPVMDLGHVVTSLNKLDAADEERIVLSSRDGKSLMVVSFADVARCLEGAFHELCSNSVPAAALQY